MIEFVPFVRAEQPGSVLIASGARGRYSRELAITLITRNEAVAVDDAASARVYHERADGRKGGSERARDGGGSPRKRAAGWARGRRKDLNFIRIRSRRRSIFLTLGYVNNLGLRAPRSLILPEGAAEEGGGGGRRRAAIAINNFVGYRTGPASAIFMRRIYRVSRR